MERSEAEELARKVLVSMLDPENAEPLPEGLSVHIHFAQAQDMPSPPTFNNLVRVATQECRCPSSGSAACVAIRYSLEVEEVRFPCECYCHDGGEDDQGW